MDFPVYVSMLAEGGCAVWDRRGVVLGKSGEIRPQIGVKNGEIGVKKKIPSPEIN